MNNYKSFPSGIHRNIDDVDERIGRANHPLVRTRRAAAFESKPGKTAPKPGWDRDLSELLVKVRIEAIERDVSDLQKMLDQILNAIERTKAIPFVSPIVTFAPEPFKDIHTIEFCSYPDRRRLYRVVCRSQSGIFGRNDV